MRAHDRRAAGALASTESDDEDPLTRFACETETWMPAAPANFAGRPPSQVNSYAVPALIAVAEFAVSADA
jgi:hypothetical protein